MIFATSRIELSRYALENNMRFLRKNLGKEVILSSVVKGNAYGHGIEEFVPLAEEFGIRHFSVFSADEAKRVLDSAGNSPTIMIMGYIDDRTLPWALENGIEFFVFDLERLAAAVEASKQAGKKALIHVDIETGMNRTGFTKEELPEVLDFIKKNKNHLELKGTCTHYAGAESIENYERIKSQIKAFDEACDLMTAEGIDPGIRHSACSAAMIKYPETVKDMVRIGVLQYGFWSSTETREHYMKRNDIAESPIKRVLSWKSMIMSIKDVRSGEYIGYGLRALAAKDMRIALVPVGYAHGYNRTFARKGRVLIRGKRAEIIGTVNMNVMILNITKIKAAERGDEVVLIGKQGNDEITIVSFTEKFGHLNYDLLSRLSSNIPRVVVD